MSHNACCICIFYLFSFYLHSQLQLRHPSTCVEMSKDPMAVKLEKSHKYLANGIYLLEQCKKSTVYLLDETNAKKLLAFLVRIYEVMTHVSLVCTLVTNTLIQ